MNRELEKAIEEVDNHLSFCKRFHAGIAQSQIPLFEAVSTAAKRTSEVEKERDDLANDKHVIYGQLLGCREALNTVQSKLTQAERERDEFRKLADNYFTELSPQHANIKLMVEALEEGRDLLACHVSNKSETLHQMQEALSTDLAKRFK